MQAKVVWSNAMAFDAHLNNHTFQIDANRAVGGTDCGPRPKGLLLISLAGCTAMDVISMLRKHKSEPETFSVETEAELAPKHPKKLERVLMRYRLTGGNLNQEKVLEAVELSREIFCGVYATLSPTVEIAHEVYINDEKIG